MRDQGVINVRSIKIRCDGILKDTNTFVLTFNTSVLPKQMKVAFLHVSVDPYHVHCDVWGWSGGAIVLGKLPVPGRPTIWITVGQGPTALVVGADGGCLDIFTLI